MNRRKVVGLFLFLLLVGLLGVPGWLTYREVRQEQLDQALIAAIEREDVPTAIWLLRQGADGNAGRRPKETLSLWQHFWDVLQGKHSKLPSAYPTALLMVLDWRHDAWGNTIALPEYPTLVKALIEHGANVNIRRYNLDGAEGYTPLMLAIMHRQDKVFELLLEGKADVNARYPGGETCLMFASDNGDDRMVEALLEQAGDVHAQDYRGWTALDYAMFEERDSTVQLLLQHGAYFHGHDAEGRMALSLARGYLADAVKQQDAHGIKVLSKIVHLLKQAGAKE